MIICSLQNLIVNLQGYQNLEGLMSHPLKKPV